MNQSELELLLELDKVTSSPILEPSSMIFASAIQKYLLATLRRCLIVLDKVPNLFEELRLVLYL